MRSKNLNYKYLLCAITAGVVLLTGFLIEERSANAVADGVGAKSALVEVAFDPGTLDAVSAVGSFAIKGTIYQLGTLRADGTAPSGATPLGNYYATGHTFGTVIADFTGETIVDGVISETYVIEGYAGTITTQGLVSAKVRAVTGGTGSFKAACGEARINRFDNGSMEVCFNFVKAIRQSP